MPDSSAVERARVRVYKDQKFGQHVGRGRLGCGEKDKVPQPLGSGRGDSL
jgi:hypothetical protein